MRASLINQYPDLESTASRLGTLLGELSAARRAQFRALAAFASGSGLRILEPALRRFLDQGHSAFWIVGVDLGGTERQALEFLYNLKREYPGRVDARVFSTGDNRSIFHPKVYWLDSDERKVVVVGSANATAGGLEENFEASLQLDLEPLTDEAVLEELDFLWMSYTSPLPPLSRDNLLELDRALIERVPEGRPPTDGAPGQQHPLQGLMRPLRRRAAAGRRAGGGGRARRAARAGQELIMDILQETRRTQVQLPVGVLLAFFRDADSVQLRQVRKGSVLKSDMRPIIHLDNNTHRIEIDAIRGLPRPQIIRFRRSPRSAAIDYEVVLRGTRNYYDLNQLLDDRGERRRVGARRWLIR